MQADRLDSKERYSKEEAVDFLEESAPDAANVRQFVSEDNELPVVWEGLNRIVVFKHLAEHGWIVTSAGGNMLWFEKIE